MNFNNVQVVSYLDDFAGCSQASTAQDDFVLLGEMLSSLGLKEAANKSVSPSTRMEFLGITFDTRKMTVEVTPERVQELLVLLKTWQDRKSASKKDIQSLIGKLQFAAKCVASGRLFVSRILYLLRGLKLPTHRRKLSKEFRKDIGWWQSFLVKFNGVSIMQDQHWLSPDTVVSTDACLEGAGGWIEGEFFSSLFPDSILASGWHINALELLSLLIALRLWCPKFKGKKLKVFCDNEASVTVLNSGRCRDKLMLDLLREIAFLCAVNHCMIRAVHLAGVDNRLADSLSRRHMLSVTARQSLDNELRSWSEQPVSVDMFNCQRVW